MTTGIGHGPVRRWRNGWFRLQCRCGDVYQCPTEVAQLRYQEGLIEAIDWCDEERRKRSFEDSVDNHWENPR